MTGLPFDSLDDDWSYLWFIGWYSFYPLIPWSMNHMMTETAANIGLLLRAYEPSQRNFSEPYKVFPPKWHLIPFPLTQDLAHSQKQSTLTYIEWWKVYCWLNLPAMVRNIVRAGISETWAHCLSSFLHLLESGFFDQVDEVLCYFTDGGNTMTEDSVFCWFTDGGS